VMINDEGNVIHKAYKSNLWHFDDRSFTAGEEFRAFDTKFGRMGMMICADGRIPEIARILALQGARVIIDLVNLVASAQHPRDVMNQQYAFMLPVRAMENGVWILAVDKCGMEGNSAVYLGRSMVISPRGEIVAECSPDREEILYYILDPEAVTETNPCHFRLSSDILCTPTEELPILKKIEAARGSVSEGERLVGVIQFRADTENEYLEKAEYYMRAAQLSYCRTIVLPIYDGEISLQKLCVKLQKYVMEEHVTVFTGCREHGTGKAAAFNKTEMVLSWGEKSGAVVEELDGVGYCVLVGRECYIPEFPRAAMLNGCEILIWMSDEVNSMDEKVARTRAAENKMFVIRTSSAENDISYLINPAGNIQTVTFQGKEQLATAMFLKAEGLSKTVFPGTDIVRTRKPGAYKELMR